MKGTCEPRGDPVPVAERVGSAFLSANFSVSPSGVLAYRAGEALPWLSRLSWFDRQGKPLGNVGEPGAYSYTDLALSPDGTHLAAAESTRRWQAVNRASGFLT